jgi:azurin
MKPLLKLIATTVFAVTLAASPQLLAQSTNKAPAEKKSSTEKKEPAEKKQGPIPFRGNIVTMDKGARTITVNKRVFQVTSETKIFKSDKPATFADGVVGDYVTGSYKKTDDGKLIAHSVYFGGKSKTSTAEKKKEPVKDSKETKS